MAKEKLDAEYLAESLHTALRKCCDSTPTTIAWNAINLMSGETWKLYIDHVLSALKGKKGEEDITRAVKKSSLKWEIIGNHAGVILSRAFGLFTDDDWYGYSSFLFEFEM